MRNIFVVSLFGIGIVAIVGAISTRDLVQNSEMSMAPVFGVIGKAPQAVDRSLSKVLPIDSVDEGELGLSLLAKYPSKITRDLPTNSTQLEEARVEVYLNILMSQLTSQLQKSRAKPFKYNVRVLSSNYPNAMALPGGVILVTMGLYKTLKSESEIVAVLGHELGHVELSHCMSTVKFQLLTKKILHSNLGEIADFTQRFLFGHSFSKTQEDDADAYGFQLLVNSQYDPSALALSFRSLLEQSKQKYEGVNLFRDYFMSHPPLEMRISKFSAEASRWWSGHLQERRYIGVLNQKEMTTLQAKDYGPAEWKHNPQ